MINLNNLKNKIFLMYHMSHGFTVPVSKNGSGVHLIYFDEHTKLEFQPELGTGQRTMMKVLTPNMNKYITYTQNYRISRTDDIISIFTSEVGHSIRTLMFLYDEKAEVICYTPNKVSEHYIFEKIVESDNKHYLKHQETLKK